MSNVSTKLHEAFQDWQIERFLADYQGCQMTLGDNTGEVIDCFREVNSLQLIVAFHVGEEGSLQHVPLAAIWEDHIYLSSLAVDKQWELLSEVGLVYPIKLYVTDHQFNVIRDMIENMTLDNKGSMEFDYIYDQLNDMAKARAKEIEDFPQAELQGEYKVEHPMDD